MTKKTFGDTEFTTIVQERLDKGWSQGRIAVYLNSLGYRSINQRNITQNSISRFIREKLQTKTETEAAPVLEISTATRLVEFYEDVTSIVATHMPHSLKVKVLTNYVKDFHPSSAKNKVF